MRRGIAIAAIQFVIFFAAGAIVAWPSLNYRWYQDDLHLIREFSGDELLLVWHHNWDVDGYESVAYRPLTVLFNHARASLFGEAMAAHRLFMVALLAIYLALIARIGHRFGLTAIATTLAGVMMICAKYSSYHFVWMADGVHVAQGIAFALALLAVLRWIRSDSAGWLWASVVLFVSSLLVREDSIAIAPVLVVLAALAARREGILRDRRHQLTGYAAALAVASVAALIARQMLLTPQTDPPLTPPLRLAAHFVEVVTLAGWQPLLLVPLFVAIFALLLLGVARLKGADAEAAWAWLVCSALSATPGIVETRVNLLFFPVTFYCLFAAQVMTAYAFGRERPFRTWTSAVATAMAAICVLVPARESRLQQLSMAPGSTGNLETDCEIARGGEWALVISPKRRDDALRELARLGLDATSCATVLDASGTAREDRLPAGAFVPSRRFLSR